MVPFRLVLTQHKVYTLISTGYKGMCQIDTGRYVKLTQVGVSNWHI